MDRIRIGYMQVNSLDAAASVHIGPGLLVGSRSVAKSITGNGEVNGDLGTVSAFAAWILDPDLIDTPAFYGCGPGYS